LAAYSFDQLSGTVLVDLSGVGNNGTITNAAWSSAGKFHGALSFNGRANSLVTIPNSPSLDLTAGMTLEAWVDPTSLNSLASGWDAAISKEHRDSSNDITYALYAAAGAGNGPAGHVLVGNNDAGAGSSSVLSLHQWVFLATTFDGSTLSLYVNGSLVSSTQISGSIFTTSDPLRIGGDWSNEMFTGLIDNVRIYNTALGQSAIQSDMATPVARALAVAVRAPSASARVSRTVTLTASAAGSVGVTGVQFYVDGKAVGPVVTPSASAGGSYSCTIGSAINFTGSATDSPADLAGMKYAWSFGDGGSSNAKNPTFTYSATGTYKVTLTVTNPDGLTATVSTSATVNAASSQPFANNGNPPSLPPPSGNVVNVSTVNQLESAVSSLQSGQTIMVAPGTYNLTGTLYVPQNLTNIAIRGADSKAGDVIIKGDAVLDATAPYNGSDIWGPGSGISGTMPFGIWLGNV
jgi:PKD repeat protein